MINFFFYHKFTNVDLIKKINQNFQMSDAYLLVKRHDPDKNILDLGTPAGCKNEILHLFSFKTPEFLFQRH